MTELVQRALVTLLRELIDGSGSEAWVLNKGDRGLLASLGRLSAEAASATPGGRSSIAAHVDHLRYGLELLNRWSRGENPFADADYAASWRRQHVAAGEWEALRANLASEARAWLDAAAHPRAWDDTTLTGALASAVHLAYHLGAIRQLDSATAGPRATD